MNEDKEYKVFKRIDSDGMRMMMSEIWKYLKKIKDEELLDGKLRVEMKYGEEIRRELGMDSIGGEVA